MTMKIHLQITSLALLLFGISSCKTDPVSDRQSLESPAELIEKDRVERSKQAVSLAEEAPGDVYETKYILCEKYCTEKPERAMITTIITWGKPTEIGFIYAEKDYPRSMAFNPRQKIVYNDITISGLSAQLVIKSNGIVPPLKKPLATAKFTPISTFSPMFFPPNMKAPKVAEAKENVRTGNVKILSVKKLSSTEANVYIKVAKSPPNLATIGAMEESVYGVIQTYAAYYKFYQDKPDIKPQQVEKISDITNMTPQVIQIKKW
jgi:hypothetical protein